jgi:hypothetical protein
MKRDRARVARLCLGLHRAQRPPRPQLSPELGPYIWLGAITMRATRARVGVEDGHGGGMAMQFARVVSPIEDMEIWNASSDGFSFVISCESRGGPGFHGPPGYVASWRSLSQNTGAIRVAGSPFKTLAEAEEACNATLGYLTRTLDGE